MRFEQVLHGDYECLVSLGRKLWPDSTREDYEKVFHSGDQAAYLCRDGDGTPAGFVIVSLRHDYVEGSRTSPVGYVEGVYVESAYRRQGIARALIAMAGQWARERGCTELGSDTELHNAVSQAFHTRIGFAEANRTVSFIKEI